MKVVIHYQEDVSNTVDFTVSKLSNLKNLIEIYPDEDITGEIRPSARNNPELNDILLAIYDHKKALWNRVPDFPVTHKAFLDTLNKNGLIITRNA